MGQRIFLSAGEVSGDLLAAAVAARLRARRPELELFGWGGEHLEQAGVEVLFRLADLDVMGFLPVVRQLGRFRQLLRDVEALFRERRPDAAVLVDYQGWHAQVARRARRLGIPVVQVVAPQVWAWAPWRVRRLRSLTRLLVILPFEEPYFRARGVAARYVGHPAVERIGAPPPPSREPGLLLLPGSRRQEWARLLPLFLAVAARLRADLPAAPITVAPARAADRRAMAPLLERAHVPVRWHSGPLADVLRRTRLALTASGTATLECAAAGVPMVVAYPAGPFARRLARWLLSVPYIALANLVAEREVVPEFLVGPGDEERLYQAARGLLLDGERWAATRAALLAVRKRLGEKRAAAAAAQEILELLAVTGP